MCDRGSKLNVTHTLTAHFGQRHFNTAFFADNVFIFHALIFTAQTFIIFDWPENSCTEKPITFRLEGTVVDRFRLFDFAI